MKRWLWLFAVALVTAFAFLVLRELYTRGPLTLYHQFRLSRPEMRQEWRRKLLVTSRADAGDLWSFEVVWIKNAPTCQNGFRARRMRLLEVPVAKPECHMIVWEDESERVCRVAVAVSDARIRLPEWVFAEALNLLGQKYSAVYIFAREYELLSLVNHDRWLKDGRLEWGMWLPPLRDKARTFGRDGTWPGVYYLFGEDGKVLEVGFFYS
ncbi:MAG: hypothetical protein HPY54_00005 [Chthonomonadetes bacterium]|jgi:hypothetical protein|nr:hypothetical protein [Chthonomonadetes bacterium]